MKKYHVKLTFTEPILGSAPCDRNVYSRFVADKKAELLNEEVEMLPENVETRGWTVFRKDKDSGSLMLLDYHIKGFLKEAASAITGKAMTAYRSKIDKLVFIEPYNRKLPIQRDGKPITDADDTVERPLRAMTMQGPRVSVARSEAIRAGAYIEFDLVVKPLGQKDMTADVLKSWFDYGQYQGLGQWRNGSFGRFDTEFTEL